MASISEILGRNIDSVKELKKAIGELQNSLIGLDSESQEFKDTSMKLAAAQDELTKVTKAGKDENIAAKDSIVGMRQEYKKLYDQYKMLSDEQRNSDFGKNMADSLEALSNKINDTQKGIGDFRGNVGRYAESISEAFNSMGVSVGALQGPLKLATGGFKSLNTVLKASPIGWLALAVAALVAVFNKLKDAVSKNEESQMRWNEAMAKFKPILDLINNAMDKLASKFVSFVEWVGKMTEKVRVFIASISDWLGITEDAEERTKELQKVYDDIAKSQNKLTIQKREYQKLNAKDKEEVERLREEASATTDLADKRQMLEEAREIQSQIDKRNIEIAQDELRILQEQAELTANDAEMNDKLAAAVARVSEAEAEASRNARMFNRQIAQTTKTTNSGTGALKNYREEAKKIFEQSVEDSKTEIQKLTEKYEKEKKLLEKYHFDTKLLTAKYNKELAALQKAEADKLADQVAKSYQDRVERATNIMSWAYKTWGEKAYYEDLTRDLLDLKKKAIDASKLEPNELENTIFTLPSTLENVDVNSFRQGFEGVMDTVRKYVKIGDLLNFEEVKKVVGDAKNGGELVKVLEEMGESGWTAYIDGVYKAAEKIGINYGVDVMSAPMFSLQTVLRENGEKAGGFFVEEFLKGVDKVGSSGDVFLMTEFAKSFKDMDWLKDSISEMNASYQDAFAKNDYNSLLEQLEKIRTTDLDALSATTDQKIQIWERYYAILAELAERQNALSELNQQRTLEMVQNIADATDSLGAALNTIKGSYETLTDSQLKAGKIDEQTAKKRKKTMRDLEIATQAFSIATIAADAASGLFSIWKGYATEVGTINPQAAKAAGVAGVGVLPALNAKSLVSAIAKTTSLAATATAQIMAARNGIVTATNNFSAESGGSTETSLGVTPALIDSTPYSYARVVQTEEDVQEINKNPIWVSVVDVENALGQRAQVVGESSF